MERVIEFFVRRRVLVLVVLGLVTLAFAAIASRAVFASSLVKLMLGEDPGYVTYKQRIHEFASDEVFVVAYEDPAPLSGDSLVRLRKASRRIRKIKDVDRVDSLLNAQRVSGRDGSLIVERYGDEARKNPDRAGAILDELAMDPLHRGLLIAPDKKHAALVVELVPDEERPMERGPEVVGEVLTIMVEEGFPRESLHRVGMLAILSEVISQTQFNITRLFPVVCLVLLLVLYLMFNRMWPVFITLVVSGVAVIWTAGFAVILDRNINILVAMSPTVILIVATSDVIHLCSAYMLELAQGSSKDQAILKSGKEVGTACLMTSATTFVGFMAMALVPVPAFRLMGFVLGFGVSVALLLAIAFTPILFSMLRAPRPWDDKSSAVQRMLSRSLGGIERVTTRKPWWVVAGFLALTGMTVWGLSKLTIETDFGKRLDDDNVQRRDQKYYDQHFVGTNHLEIFVEAPDKDGLLDPDAYARMTAFQQQVEALPEVDKVISLIDLVERIDAVMNPRGTGQARPMTRELLSQYLLLFEMSGGEDLDRLLDFDRKTMRLAARLKIHAVRQTREVGDAIQQIAASTLPENMKTETTGLSHLMGGFLDEIIVGQRRGLLIAFVTIMLLMVFWMRSVRVGVLSMIPNAIPLFALGGLVGLVWEQMDSDVIAIAMIAIGIGVDDTIHFLVRLRFESERNPDTVSSLSRTFHFSGRAIVITTVILAMGFLPFALSDYLTIHIIGILIPFTLVVALLADILLVPAMVRLGAIRFHRPLDRKE